MIFLSTYLFRSCVRFTKYQTVILYLYVYIYIFVFPQFLFPSGIVIKIFTTVYIYIKGFFHCRVFAFKERRLRKQAIETYINHHLPQKVNTIIDACLAIPLSALVRSNLNDSNIKSRMIVCVVSFDLQFFLSV